MARAIGIEPGVKLEAALMSLLHRQREGIVERRRRTPHLPGEILGPGLDPRSIEGISRRPHLQENGVQPQLLRTVQQRQQLGLLLLRGQAGPRRPVDVLHRRNPYPPEFPGHDRRLHC